MFLAQRGLGVGLALYAPAVVMAVILGWSESVTIVVMGVLVVSYTVVGGIKAVMWTDAQQMIVMFLGIVAAFFAAVAGLPEGVSFDEVTAVRRRADGEQVAEVPRSGISIAHVTQIGPPAPGE